MRWKPLIYRPTGGQPVLRPRKVRPPLPPPHLLQLQLRRQLPLQLLRSSPWRNITTSTTWSTATSCWRRWDEAPTGRWRRPSRGTRAGRWAAANICTHACCLQKGTKLERKTHCILPMWRCCGGGDWGDAVVAISKGRGPRMKNPWCDHHCISGGDAVFAGLKET